MTQIKSGAKSRVVAYVVAAVTAALIVIGAWNQESIAYYFKMRAWDPDAPGRTVLEFLRAGKRGDQDAATRLLASEDLKPLTTRGKWSGYSLTTLAGTLEYVMSELTPATEPEKPKTEFIYRGDGSAIVTVPDRSGQEVSYRLLVAGGGWKIAEIRGGRVAR